MEIYKMETLKLDMPPQLFLVAAEVLDSALRSGDLPPEGKVNAVTIRSKIAKFKLWITKKTINMTLAD